MQIEHAMNNVSTRLFEGTEKTDESSQSTSLTEQGIWDTSGNNVHTACGQPDFMPFASPWTEGCSWQPQLILSAWQMKNHTPSTQQFIASCTACPPPPSVNALLPTKIYFDPSSSATRYDRPFSDYLCSDKGRQDTVACFQLGTLDEGPCEAQKAYRHQILSSWAHGRLLFEVTLHNRTPNLRLYLCLSASRSGYHLLGFAVQKDAMTNFYRNHAWQTLNQRRLPLLLDVDKTLIICHGGTPVDLSLPNEEIMSSPMRSNGCKIVVAASDKINLWVHKSRAQLKQLNARLKDPRMDKSELSACQQKISELKGQLRQHKGLLIQPRHGLHEFLEVLHEIFDLYLLSAGTQPYVEAIWAAFDWESQGVKRQNVISCNWTRHQDDFCIKDFGMACSFGRDARFFKMFLAVDDTKSVWKNPAQQPYVQQIDCFEGRSEGSSLPAMAQRLCKVFDHFYQMFEHEWQDGGNDGPRWTKYVTHQLKAALKHPVSWDTKSACDAVILRLADRSLKHEIMESRMKRKRDHHTGDEGCEDQEVGDFEDSLTCPGSPNAYD